MVPPDFMGYRVQVLNSRDPGCFPASGATIAPPRPVGNGRTCAVSASGTMSSSTTASIRAAGMRLISAPSLMPWRDCNDRKLCHELYSARHLHGDRLVLELVEEDLQRLRPPERRAYCPGLHALRRNRRSVLAPEVRLERHFRNQP